METATIRGFYEYFEERPFTSQIPGRRRRNVAGNFSMTAQLAHEFRPSRYGWYKTRQLEGTLAAGDEMGAWPINYCRVARYFGDPGYEICPDPIEPRNWPANVDDLARRFRLHHYFRVPDSSDLRNLPLGNVDVRVVLEVTEEWHNPRNGIIEDTSNPPRGVHAVPIHAFDAVKKRFKFVNSWGEKWGDGGLGELSVDVLDRYMIEAWGHEAAGIEPPIESCAGLVCLLWKASIDREVHAREIVDAQSHERIAWTFLVRRGQYLDIEEFFVWPKHRGKGYGNKLVQLIQELVRQSNLELRAWVSFADAGAENRAGLIEILRLLGLSLHPSPNRFAAFIATKETAPAVLSEPQIPERPASVRDRLDPEVGTRLYTVWFGTNRKPIDPAGPSKGFSGERDKSVHYGICKVAIPKSHRFGSIGSKWWQRWLRSTDDRLLLAERIGHSPKDFWSELAGTLNNCDAADRHGLVFLHGYNVGFDEAAIRAAQIGFDLKVPGVTAFFSWPSCGSVHGYAADEACIEASEPFIASFLQDFVARSGATQVHLIAHSMGNRGLLRSLQRLAAIVAQESSVRFGQIILAAADIDVDTFTSLSALYQRFSERTTLYASQYDLAVGVSRLLHNYHRVGLTPPVRVVPGVDTVEVPGFNIFESFGHGYFAEAAALLHDIFDLIRRNASPDDRQRLARAETPDRQTYWTMSP